MKPYPVPLSSLVVIINIINILIVVFVVDDLAILIAAAGFG